MVKEWFFSIFITMGSLIVIQAQSQRDVYFKEQGLSYSIQTFVLFDYDDGVGRGYDTDYELEYDTKIFGLNGEVTYYFDPTLGVGLGLGYERITQPLIEYYPLYLNLIGPLGKTKDAYYMKFNFGIHLGNLDKPGFIFRTGFGYRFKVYKDILSNMSFSYSFQNLFKSFDQSGRPENYYNIESIGLTIGIEFN